MQNISVYTSHNANTRILMLCIIHRHCALTHILVGPNARRRCISISRASAEREQTETAGIVARDCVNTETRTPMQTQTCAASATSYMAMPEDERKEAGKYCVDVKQQATEDACITDEMHLL